MKILILLFVAGFSILGNLHSQTCGYEHYTKYLEEKYPGFSETVKQTFKNVKSVPKHKSPNVIYRVPVVFHIVHENEQENFSDDLIYDQIVVLNEDFRMMNANSADTRDIFKEFAADVGIEFYLADTDPDGNPTTGITRTETNVTSFFGNDLDRVKQGDMGGKDAWDTDRYLNIWTCDLSLDFTMGEPVFYGFAFPPNGLSNWPTSLFTPDEYEGVVLHYQVVGRNHPGASENLLELTSAGRTLTHEVGHYLGLPHIWGNGDCDFDDGFNDTPTASIESSPTVDAPIPCDHNHTKDTCDEDNFPDMVENFMDCNKQDCQTMFTQEQADFMVQVLTGPRASLIENSISSETIWYADVDGDTYGDDNDTVIDCEQPNGYVDRGGDCDDINETVYPNAEELCDDLDNDCNSIIDDGLPFFTVYEDKDDDGYGDLETEAFDCEVKAGFVENGDDCDDLDPATNPDAIELCDDVDNNCDGQVDEGLAQNTFYADNDGDGYGDTDSIIESCNMSIQGYATNGDDCDDANPYVNPNQQEEPYNGIDDDCNSTTLDDDFDEDGFLFVDDCDDTDPNINPDVDEIPNNGIDEDCDGMDLISSIHELSNSIINIYPNPAFDIINIDSDGNLNFQANLYNLNGKLIKTSSNKNRILLESTPAGTYLLEIKDLKRGQIIVERIVIGR